MRGFVEKTYSLKDDPDGCTLMVRVNRPLLEVAQYDKKEIQFDYQIEEGNFILPEHIREGLRVVASAMLDLLNEKPEGEKDNAESA